MVEVPQDIARYYRSLRQHVKTLPLYNHRISISIQKLSKFSISHLTELSCDIFDEIQRREGDSSEGGHLEPRKDIHQKRNNARYQFGDLSVQRFGDMCLDVLAELDRRYPSLQSGPVSVSVPEIPPLHRTRTLGKSAGAASSRTPLASESLDVPQPPKSAPSQNVKNVKQTKVIPTKSTMVMEDSDNEDSQSDEYEYYNPDLSDSASGAQSTSHNSLISTVGDRTHTSLLSNSSSGRTPFEERLAASSKNLGFDAPSNSDFYFGVEEQLIESRSSRLPPNRDSNLDELNAFDRSSQATMLSPVTQSAPQFETLNVLESPKKSHEPPSPALSVENRGSYTGSIARSFVSNESLSVLGGPDTDLVEYINRLEDQVKELEQVNAQSLEENQQLHNMLADTENERKQMAQKVETLRESSIQPQDHPVTLDEHASLQPDENLEKAEAKIKALEAQVAALLSENSDLKASQEQLKAVKSETEERQRDLSTDHNELGSKYELLNNEHCELQNKHSELLYTHGQLKDSHSKLQNELSGLQESHRELESSHNDLRETHGNLQATHNTFQEEYVHLKAKNAELVSKEAETEPNSVINAAKLNGEHASLTDRYDERRHATLENEHRAIKQDYATLQEAFMDLQTRYANLQNEHAIREPGGLNIKNLGSNEEYEALLAEHNTLLKDLERQRQITEQVRQEAQRFLGEMRTMTESGPSSRIVSLQQELATAEQQVAYWKSRCQKSVEESRTTRTQHRESMLLQPTSVSEAFFDADGLISGDAVEKYQDSVTELLQATRESPDCMLEYLHFTVLATEELLGEVDSDDTRFAKQTRLVIRTANQLISTVRNFSESAPLFPAAIVAAACSDLSYAVCEFLKQTKVRPGEFLKFRRKSGSAAPRSISTRKIKGNEFPRPPYSPDTPNDQGLPVDTSRSTSSNLKEKVPSARSTEDEAVGESSAHSIYSSPQGSPTKSAHSSPQKRYNSRTSIDHSPNRSATQSSPAREAARLVGSKVESARPISVHYAKANQTTVQAATKSRSDSQSVNSLSQQQEQEQHHTNDSVHDPLQDTGYEQNAQSSRYTNPGERMSSQYGAENSREIQGSPEFTADTSVSPDNSQALPEYAVETARAIQSSPVRSVQTVNASRVASSHATPMQTSSDSHPTERKLSRSDNRAPLVVDTHTTSMASSSISLTPSTSEIGNATTRETKTPSLSVEAGEGSPGTPNIRRHNEAQINADSTVAELQAYLEEQTSETVDSIRELLSGIKVDAVVAELKPRVDSIVYYVHLMVTTTGVCMKRTENWLLKDKGSFILQNLDDCCRRMRSLRENLDQLDSDDVAPRPLKQRLAGVSFDMAKCTKELVKTVEDVSLKSELESIDARLQGAA